MRVASPFAFHVLIAAIVYLSYASADLRGQIPLNSYANVTKNSTWCSQGGVFAMGFLNAGISFSLAISFALPGCDSAVVWNLTYPNTDRVVLVSRHAVLKLEGDGNLLLYDGHPVARVLWASNTSAQGVTMAEVLDTGNFVLWNASKQIVWQSFMYPTNVLLPQQNISQGTRLYPRQSHGSDAQSLYSLLLQADGKLCLFWNASESYWCADTTLRLTTYDRVSAGSVKVLNVSGKQVASWDEDGVGIFMFLRVESDGNLRIYQQDPVRKLFVEEWKAVEQCRVYKVCGPFGICSTHNGSHTCACPQGFQLVDSTDWAAGCRSVDVACHSTNFTEVVDVHYDGVVLDRVEGEQVDSSEPLCKASCTKNCDCVGISFQTQNCTRYSALFNGRQLGTNGLRFSVKVSGKSKASSPGNFAFLGVGIGVGAVAAMMVCCSLFCIWKYRAREQGGDYVASFDPETSVLGSTTRFSFLELQTATSHFREKLGAGGFGAVYKGVLEDQTVVAVKQLERKGQGEKEFRAEVATIGNTHHKNLARLYGFCSEGSHRLLVYEYLSRGSLDKYLCRWNDEEDIEYIRPLLNWSTRFNVALGIAQGLAYLHEECRECIIHCDIKPENILLDDRFCAKVSDFGLAKLLTQDENRAITAVRGTWGYLAPEWLADSPLTVKADVYSFGKVLLEIIAGRRNFEISVTTDKENCSGWVWIQVAGSWYVNVMDQRLQGIFDVEQAERLTRVGLWCTQDEPDLRPSMGKVVRMLEGVVEVLAPPIPKSVKEYEAEPELSSSNQATPFREVVPLIPSSKELRPLV